MTPSGPQRPISENPRWAVFTSGATVRCPVPDSRSKHGTCGRRLWDAGRAVRVEVRDAGLRDPTIAGISPESISAKCLKCDHYLEVKVVTDRLPRAVLPTAA